MRTTLTLDSDVVALLREEMDRSRLPFKQVVNQMLRLGLRAATPPEKRRAFRTEPWDFGGLRPGIDPNKLNQLADQLEDEEILRKIRRDSGQG